MEEIEKSFVEKYIINSKKERLLFELSGKKRREGLERFCHNAEEMLSTEKIATSGNHLLMEDILDIINKEQKALKTSTIEFGNQLEKASSDPLGDVASNITGSNFGKCYIMAYHEEFDKKTLTIDEALKLVLGNGMPAIVIGDHFAIIETEQCFGTPMRYILHD